MPLKKIVFVIPDLKQGGAERVVATLANQWSSKGFEVSIITFDTGNSFFLLDGNIKIVPLQTIKKGFLGSLRNSVKRSAKYIKNIREIKPDVIISFMDYPNVLCLLWNIIVKQKLIISQRTEPTRVILPAVFVPFRKILYKKADAIVVQTERALQTFESIHIQLPKIKRVIPNPINEDCYDTVLPAKENIILAVGRLEPEKQFSLLIDIFSKLQNTGWELWIVGAGSEMAALKDQVERSGLCEKVKIAGVQKNTKEYYQRSKIFALTSKFEGYPNALCEAMANGCACISFDCNTGPSEIITHDVNGLLIEKGNTVEFQKQLQSLMGDEKKIAALGAEALTIRGTLNTKNISDQWYALMHAVLNN